MTEAMNRALNEVDETSDPFVSEAAMRILRQTEW
jgi:hypothetical protein